MNLKNLGLLFLAILSFVSCSEDRHTFIISQDEQNRIDDKALVKYLEEHYFTEDGSVKAFNKNDDKDDHFTPLKALAEKSLTGYYVVKNPKHHAQGPSISDYKTDEILIQYNLQSLKAMENRDSIYYLSSTIVSTVNDQGLPEWNPIFYRASEGSSNSFELLSIIEGLKEFKSSEKNIDGEPYIDFQGLILVPSRLAYGRSSNPFNMHNIQDISLILNFELYQVKKKS